MAGLLYGASYDSTTHTVSLTDKAGNVILSFVADITPPQIVDDPTKPLYIRSMANGGSVYLYGPALTTDTFEKSTDGTTWTAWALGSANAITLNRLEGVYIRTAAARTEFPSSGTTSPLNIILGGTGVTFEAYHNVNSLLDPSFSSITDLSSIALSGSGCFKRLFYQQSALVKTPLLPATTLSEFCYLQMFYSCTGLTETPTFPWTTTAAGCCAAMFDSCTNITTVHDFHASTIAGVSATASNGAYHNMFQGCSGIINPPVLNATEVGRGGCARMFKGCSSLATAPVLPTTVTGTNAFERMFQDCTSLTASPVIDVPTLTNSCCNLMFSGCSSLNEVRINSTDISASSCLSNWLQNVAATGDFYGVYGVAYPVNSASGIPQGWTDHRSMVDDPNLPLYLKSTQNGSTVALNKLSTHSSSDIYQKSTDNVNWTTFDSAVTLNDGDGIFVRISANRATTFSNNLHVQFAMSGAIQAYNNINSLVSPTFSNLADLTTVVGSGAYCHCRLFDSCTALTKAPLLPSTTLSEGCYRATFTGCTGLTQPPELPATAMAESCYRATFDGCTGLTQAPALPAMTLAPYCYYYMLKGCTFTAAPVLPATTLANYCYGGLFNNCTSLVTAPAMAATTLAPQCCQQMFWGCTSLTRGPDLLALTLTTDCYDRIFQDCSSLNEVHLYATASVTASNLYNWLSNVSASGAVYCDPSITLTANSASGLPTGWTRTALS